MEKYLIIQPIFMCLFTELIRCWSPSQHALAVMDVGQYYYQKNTASPKFWTVLVKQNKKQTQGWNLFLPDWQIFNTQINSRQQQNVNR